MGKKQLTEDEQRVLIGGTCSNLNEGDIQTGNHNEGGGCKCEYNNRPTAILNMNKGNCSCVCV